jgi:hypothetical protein
MQLHQLDVSMCGIHYIAVCTVCRNFASAMLCSFGSALYFLCLTTVQCGMCKCTTYVRTAAFICIHHTRMILCLFTCAHAISSTNSSCSFILSMYPVLYLLCIVSPCIQRCYSKYRHSCRARHTST